VNQTFIAGLKLASLSLLETRHLKANWHQFERLHET